MQVLSETLRAQMKEAARLNAVIDANLKEIGYGV